MESWVIFALVAAAAQTVRFALQKVLAGSRLSASGATFARFVWSAPLAAILAAGYAVLTDIAVPWPNAIFFAWAVVGGLFQIFATILTLQLFRSRAFAVGITLKKTEVILTAVVGFVILGDRISLLGFGALLVGFGAVAMLADPRQGGRVLTRSSALGLGSGLCFAVSAVAYRGAALELPMSDPLLVGGVTLAVVTLWQTCALGAWLGSREPGQVTAVLSGWRQTGLVGLFSLIGSWCWFSAFSLANAAYVFAVGQIELLFSFVVGLVFFGERLRPREIVGMAMLALSIITIVWIG